MSQKSSSNTVKRTFDDTKLLPCDTFYFVVIRQPFVQNQPVRIHKFQQAAIFVQDSFKEPMRLLDHRNFQQLVELRIQCSVGFCETDVAKVEPLAGKVLGERSRFWISQEPLDLGSQYRRPVKFVFGCKNQELLIRLAAPEEVRQP